MSPLNYLYAAILSVALAHWFYRLAIQHVDGPDKPQKVAIYMGFILVGFMMSDPILTWMASPDLAWHTWWKAIIPEDQLPSRVFFWVLLLSLIVLLMTGIMTSEWWNDFIDGSDSDFFWIISGVFLLLLWGSFLLSYAFCIFLFHNLMRLA